MVLKQRLVRALNKSAGAAPASPAVSKEAYVNSCSRTVNLSGQTGLELKDWKILDVQPERQPPAIQG